MRSKNKTEAEWMTLIQTCRSSGLTDRSWCEQNGISINTFYNTISKLRKKSCVIPKSPESRVNELPEIVPVSVSSEDNTLVSDVSGQWNTDTLETDTIAAITVTVNGCSVEIKNNAGRDLIYNTLSALQQL